MLGFSGSPRKAAVLFFPPACPSILMHCYMLNCVGSGPWSRALWTGSWPFLWRGSVGRWVSEYQLEAKGSTERRFPLHSHCFCSTLGSHICHLEPLLINSLPILFSASAHFIFHGSARVIFLQCKANLRSLMCSPDISLWTIVVITSASFGTLLCQAPRKVPFMHYCRSAKYLYSCSLFFSALYWWKS
jgi:hypothetical protein